MAGLLDFARKLWPGWSSASIILCAGALLVEVGMWIAPFVSAQ